MFDTTDSAELDRNDPETAYAIHARVNLATLAILSRCAPATWLCRPSASAIVHGTDLHAIPDAPPRLLRAPGIVETRRPETGERLWGDYASLGWYDVNGLTLLLGLRYPDGYTVARWTPQWTGEELEPQLPGVDRTSPLIGDLEEHTEFARDAARYLIVLGLLAEAENSPLRIELDRRERATRHVYCEDQPARGRESSDPIALPPSELGRVPEKRSVSAYMKRQRHGPSNSKTKWIYIQEHSAVRWFASRWNVDRHAG